MTFAVPTCEDVEPLLAEVRRFAQRTIRGRTERAEHPMPSAILLDILTEADAMGLAGADLEPIGLGLWEDLTTSTGVGRTIAVLALLGRESPAVALALHQFALGRLLLRSLGLAGHGLGAVVATPWGEIGVGREPLAWLLDGAALDRHGLEMLADVYGPRAARVVTLAPSFGGWLTPVVDAEGSLAWALHARSSLAIEHAPHAHGFDELTTAVLRSDEAPAYRVNGAVAHETFAAALRAEALGRVAISLGALQRAHDLARTYAATRKQGQSTIDRHGAVRLLLARGHVAQMSVGTRLRAAAALAPSVESTVTALATRAASHPEISDAANDAMQVFGGLGYMRDTGLEKIVRDTNHLRVGSGSPRELQLLVAEWERIRD